MGTHRSRENVRKELMGDNIIGMLLSEELLQDSNTRWGDPHPKLQRFPHHEENIHFSRLLGSGKHGVVLLTEIEGVEYAFKIFKEWEQHGPVFDPYPRAIFTTPLAKESQAFARLNSRNENGTWACRCYGWMRLSDTQLKTAASFISIRGLSRWAIVKEYEPTPTTPSHILRIFVNFTIPWKARILPEDLRMENYRGAKIVDLSSALTNPCPEWQDFQYRFFYRKTIYGVFDWFKGHKISSLWTALQYSLTRAFVLTFRPFPILTKIR